MADGADSPGDVGELGAADGLGADGLVGIVAPDELPLGDVEPGEKVPVVEPVEPGYDEGAKDELLGKVEFGEVEFGVIEPAEVLVPPDG